VHTVNPDETEAMATPAPSAPARRGLERAGPVALFATIFPVSGALATVAIGPLVAPWLREQGMAGVVLFTVVFAVLGALALATTYSTSIIAGWTFGFALGFAAVMIGTVVGATLCYLLALRLAGDRIRALFGEHPRWEIVRRALMTDRPLKTVWIVFLMRLSPVLPFGTTNVLLATAGVPLGVYLLGTLLGLMPRLGLIALAAAGAEQLDFTTAESRWMLAGGIVATAACITVLAVSGKRALDRATRPPQGNEAA
jgi:uncharacterized membrane protein YdjX (TVP38/TMEM64 family)